jgi:hypothetical protein
MCESSLLLDQLFFMAQLEPLFGGVFQDLRCGRIQRRGRDLDGPNDFRVHRRQKLFFPTFRWLSLVLRPVRALCTPGVCPKGCGLQQGFGAAAYPFFPGNWRPFHYGAIRRLKQGNFGLHY